MNDIFNISSKNSYLTSKQWKEVVEYVKNRKNIVEESVVEETEEIIEESTSYEVQHSEAYEQLVQATSVEEMYIVLLTIMNGSPEKLYEMNSDELQVLYNIAAQMNEKNPSDDYIDLSDTLQYLAGEYDLNGAEILIPTGTVLSATGGALTSGSYYLNQNITLSKNLTIANNAVVSIDLNGYVLTGAGSGSVITSYGTLTIKDSDPNKLNYGNLNTDKVWIHSTDSSGTLIKGGIITNKGVSSGLSVSGGTCTIEGGAIAGCKNTSGAGVVISSTGVFRMTGGRILYNYATDSKLGGGAIYGEPAHNNSGSRIYISNAEISYNRVVKNGGAIHGYIVELSNTIISHNYAGNCGGGIYILNNTTGENDLNASLTISNNSSIDHNGSVVYGGGIYCEGDLNVSNTSIAFNYCGKDESDTSATSKNNKGRGGGIYLESSSETKPALGTFDGISLNNNSAMYYGGGIQITGEYASFTLNSGEISGNKAYLGGAAAIHVTSKAVANINGGKISSNIAVSGRGGGIHSAYGCTVNLNSGEVSNNEVTGRGAGIHVNAGGIINLNGTTICNNKAFSGNKLEYCQLNEDNGEFTPIWTGEEIYEEGYGGGVVIDCGELYISRGQVLNNYAEVGGGGIALVMYSTSIESNKVVKFNLSGGEISNNATDGNGGGVYLMRNTLKEIYEDTSKIPEELLNGIPTFIASGGIISNNFAQNNGGAAYLETNTECYINGDSYISKNSAVNFGGAIYVDKGEMEIDGGLLEENTSQNDGGAIYICGNVNMKKGILANNIALNHGGAIVATSGDITIGTKECHDAGEFSTHIHPVIEGNIAADGGGIYVDGGVTTMWCGDIKHNLTYEKTVNVIVKNGNFTYKGGSIGIPYDSGVFINGGIFEDNSSDSEEILKHELHYHSVLGDEIHNGKIPESKWIASPRGNILHKEYCDDTSVTWGDLFPKYEFVGWENHDEKNDTVEIVNLYAIWEEK